MDPANRQAYSGLSQSYLMIGIFGLRLSKEIYPKARAAAMKAIEIDHTTADAHGVLAELRKAITGIGRLQNWSTSALYN